MKKYFEWLNESIKDGVITCDNCGWKWDIVTGGDDPYKCHKCGHSNSPLAEKKSPFKKETLEKYRKEYEEGKDIPFGVKTSLIAQGMIPHEGGPDKGKKKKTELYEAQMGIADPSIDVDQIIYGNAPKELHESALKPEDPIKNWFLEKGLAEQMKNEAPSNSSETTQADLRALIELTENATAEDITFARYVDKVDNLAQSFIDLLKEHGHEEDMGGFFEIDSQTEGLLFFLKDIINRPRPYQLARTFNYPLYPLIRTDAMTAAYPSGHALTAFVMSEYYAKKYPDCAVQLKDLGERIAKSRENTGIHFPSDTAVSKKICDIIFENKLLQG